MEVVGRLRRRVRRLRRFVQIFMGRMPNRLARFFGRLRLIVLGQTLRIARGIRARAFKLGIASTCVLFVASLVAIPTLQVILEPVFAIDELPLTGDRLGALRSLLVTVGGALIGATAIAFSVVMLAVQLNFARMPFGLFRRLSSDARLLTSFAATFILGIAVGIASLVPDTSWIALTIVLSCWCSISALILFLFAYRRALELINPTKQLQFVLQKATKSLNRWERWATLTTPLLQRRPQTVDKRDIARATFFRAQPHWEDDAREAVNHAISFARRYAEQGEYDVARNALASLVAVNAAYIRTRGRTFFAPNVFFNNPLSHENFISDTLEHLRRLALHAQNRSDEEQFVQVLNAFSQLCHIYASIDYGEEHGNKLHHSQLAAGYMVTAIEGGARTFARCPYGRHQARRFMCSGYD